MGPKRSSHKQKAISPRGMTLRSKAVGKRQVLEDGSSRVHSLRSPKRYSRHKKRCVFVDDEASVDRSVDGGSNFTLDSHERNVDPNDIVQATPPQSKTIGTLSAEDINKNLDLAIDEEEAETKHNRVFGQDVPLGLMNDVMKQFYLQKQSEPPSVPLCRLIPTDAVRSAVDEASWLIPLFDRAGYVPTMGSFTVSLKGRHGEVRPVTQSMIDNWDPIWQKLNAEFEENLVEEWEELRGKAFFVWDGNHRLKTWMKRIEAVHSKKEIYHALVKCQFIEFDKKKEAELFLSLNTTNEISRATTPPNLGHEIFMFRTFGLANKQSIMERLTPEQRSWMDLELKMEARHNQGIAPWYSTPCILISQLVWKGKWEHFLAEESSRLKSLGLIGVEYKKKMDDAIKREEERMRDSGYKYLSIANPIHGDEFFSILIKKDWNDKSMVGITRDKLYCLCTAKISLERRKELLHMMTLTKVKDPKATHFADYKKLRSYMRQEAY